jgi:hypothetical protein
MEQELAAYQETWKNNSDFLFALLRPELPSTITLDPGLKALYQDCYQTLLIGRYNASIVMMGVFLEGLMKERIRLKTGKDFPKPYGQCVDRLMGIKRLKERIERAGDGCNLIESKDITFLDRFRDKVRNVYAHFDEAKVVDGRIMQAWEIPLDFSQPAVLPKLKTAIEEAKAGKRKPMLLDAKHPALRSVSKFQSDPMTAVRLFNLVYDFALGFMMKYLRQKDYDECHKRFPYPFVDLSPELEKRGLLKRD